MKGESLIEEIASDVTHLGRFLMNSNAAYIGAVLVPGTCFLKKVQRKWESWDLDAMLGGANMAITSGSVGIPVAIYTILSFANGTIDYREWESPPNQNEVSVNYSLPIEPSKSKSFIIDNFPNQKEINNYEVAPV